MTDLLGSSRTNYRDGWLFYCQRPMPRRSQPEPIARAVGQRIRALREEAGLTLEKLAYESEVGSKGYLSDIERGLAMPSLSTLQRIADHLDVLLLDLFTDPGGSTRERLIDATRQLPNKTISTLMSQASLERPGRRG